jgi:hypothetical protein
MMLANRSKLVEEGASRVYLGEVILHWLGRGRDVICELTHGIGISYGSCEDAVNRLSAQLCHCLLHGDLVVGKVVEMLLREEKVA